MHCSLKRCHVFLRGCPTPIEFRAQLGERLDTCPSQRPLQQVKNLGLHQLQHSKMLRPLCLRNPCSCECVVAGNGERQRCKDCCFYPCQSRSCTLALAKTRLINNSDLDGSLAGFLRPILDLGSYGGHCMSPVAPFSCAETTMQKMPAISQRGSLV